MADIRDQWEAAILASNLRDRLKICAWAIRYFANSNGECYPSAATLGKIYRTTRRTVFRHLEELAVAGWIRRAPGQGASGRGGKTTLIQLKIPGSGDAHSATTSSDPNAEVVTETARSGDNLDRSGDSLARSGDNHVSPKPVTNRTNRTSAKRGSRRAPKNYQIDDNMKAWLREQSISFDFAQTELANFLDHEFRDPRKDWNASFRTWMRNAKKWQSPGTAEPSAQNQVDELAAKLGLSRESGESDERFESRVTHASVNEQYGYSDSETQH